MDDSHAIIIENISKVFKLPHEKSSSLKSHIIHPFRHRGFKRQQALTKISLSIKKGEFFGIVGRNGSGKSTLLKIIAGIYQPTEGKVFTRGKLVPFIELGVGFNPELTGRENVYLNGAMLGFSKKEVRAMYKDIVSFAELEDFMGQKLKNYSSGMQVRLAFSMAIRAQADILLIDEVLAVGDADFQRKCFDYFNHLRKSDTTVIFVSHNMDAVREYCDRAMLIENSKVAEIGSTDVISEKYLRMFMEDDSPKRRRGPDKRWGDQSIKIHSIDVKVTHKQITITEVIKATKNIERPIVGFRIRDAAGNEITGTNTRVEQKPLNDFKKGQKATLIWSLPNILRDGRYMIDPAILHANEITVADWWNEAVDFVVKKDRHLPYTIDPEFNLTVE